MKVKAYRNLAQILTMEGAHKKNGRKIRMDDLSILIDASIVFSENQILWIGPDHLFPSKYSNCKSIDLSGHVLTPEIVDSHTHLIFGGNRAQEYSMRLRGATYEEIANQGGGILSTMRATQELDGSKLRDLAFERIEKIHSYGIGTIEIKSGYGLTYQKEMEISYLIDELKQKYKGRIQIINTFLAAHAIPPQFKTSKEYMDEVVLPLFEKMAKERIIDIVDIFYEQNYFSREDAIRLFSMAEKFSVSIKIHADEFTNLQGAELAASFKALSADHLLQTGDEGIQALAQSETVATLLPGTGLFLGKKQADARKFLDAGVKVALASDYNPGSCHCDNLILIASLAAPQFKMNIAEFWNGITLNAAHALGLKDQGALLCGLKPRFSLFKASNHEEIPYQWGKNLATYLP